MPRKKCGLGYSDCPKMTSAVYCRSVDVKEEIKAVIKEVLCLFNRYVIPFVFPVRICCSYLQRH